MEKESLFKTIFKKGKAFLETVLNNRVYTVCFIVFVLLLAFAIVAKSFAAILALFGSLFGGVVTEERRQEQIKKSSDKLVKTLEKLDSKEKAALKEVKKPFPTSQESPLDIRKILDDELKK